MDRSGTLRSRRCLNPLFVSGSVWWGYISCMDTYGTWPLADSIRTAILFIWKSKFLPGSWLLSHHLLLPPSPTGSLAFNQCWNETVNMPKGFFLHYLLYCHHSCEQPGLESCRCLGTFRGQASAWYQILLKWSSCPTPLALFGEASTAMKVKGNLYCRATHPGRKTNCPLCLLSCTVCDTETSPLTRGQRQGRAQLTEAAIWQRYCTQKCDV